MGKQAEGNGARRRQRRSFTPEFKAEVIALVRRRERSVPAICRELDLSETAVRRWVAQAAVDAGERDGLTIEEREELRRLRRENKVLREEREILKKAALGSPGQRNALREDFGRRAKFQRLPGTLVEATRHAVEVALGVRGEDRAFRKVLPQQAIRVLVGSPLPRTLRIAEVDLDVRGDGERGVSGQLHAPIPCQRLPQLGR